LEVKRTYSGHRWKTGFDVVDASGHGILRARNPGVARPFP